MSEVLGVARSSVLGVEEEEGDEFRTSFTAAECEAVTGIRKVKCGKVP